MKNTTSIWLIWLNVIVAVLLTIAPHFSTVQNLLSLGDITTSISWLISIVSIFYLLTSTYLMVNSNKSLNALIEVNKKIESSIDMVNIRPFRDDDFYHTFLNQIDEAKSHVSISYLGNNNPDYSRDEERTSYYEGILSTMRHKKKVAFRRLLRDTPSNRHWAKKRITAWSELPNISVALLEDLPPDEEMPLALSLQIIDENIVWFVAIQGHERIGPYRDLMVENENAAQFMNLYFNRLWNHAKVVVDKGNLTEFGIKIQNSD